MAALMIACARHAGAPEARFAAPRSTALSMRYEATEAVAQEQREAYFALMPSKALPTVCALTPCTPCPSWARPKV